MNVNPPESHVATACPEDVKLRIAYRDGQGELHLSLAAEALPSVIADREGTLWVDIEDPGNGSSHWVETLLRDTFGFHPLAIEDALRETHLPKLDDWGDYIYVVFHATSIDPSDDGLRLHEMDIFLGPNYLVTYHTEPLSFLDEDRQSIEHDPRDRLRHGPDHLLIRLMERAVDQTLVAIEQLDDRVDDIQNQVLEYPRSQTLETIFRVKRTAIRLHKIFAPQREVLNRLARDPFNPIRAEYRIYYRDLYDHSVRIHDISASLRELIAGTVETYLSVMSNRTNDIMKALTFVTVMFMPMSFVVGFFGMNFFGDTLAFETPLPKATLFFLTLLVICVSPTLMWMMVRRRKWF